MAKTRIKPGFLNLPPGSRVRENRGKSEGLSPLGSSSESRIKPGFFLYLTLLISPAAQCLGTQVAHAALGRRGFLRAASPKARAQAWERQVKVSSTFSKVVGFGVKPQDLTGVRGRSHRLPILQKRGGRMSPSWGASATALGAICFAACAPSAASFHRLRRLKVAAF